MKTSKIMSLASRFAVAFVLCGVVMALSGCNTMAGLGQDIESGGAAMEDAARDVQHGD